MWTRKQIKTKAKEAFKVNYWKCVLVGLIFCVIVGGASGTFSGATSGMSSTSSGLIYNSTKVDEEVDSIESDMDDMEDELDEIADKIDEIDNEENADEDDITAIGFTVASSSDEDGEIDVDGTSIAFGLAAFGFFMLAAMIIILITTAVGLAIKILLINPVEFGCKNFFRRNLDEPANLSSVTFGFDKNYKNAVKTGFFKDLFVWLWSLLFVIPGIIKAYEYRLVPYIYAENPDMKYSDILAESSKLMKGNKWKTFVLDLSFIGWEILSLMTCGLLSVFYVDPYRLQTDAALYEAIKYGDNGSKEVATAA